MRLSSSAPDWLTGCTYAHRGLHGPGVPENSLAAFSGAVERGFGIELDVHLSANGIPVVFHDWELGRLTDATGPLGRRTATELGAILLNGSNQPIPTLQQVLDRVGGQVPLLAEIKSREDMQVDALCRAVRDLLADYHGPHAVIGFDPRAIRWFADHAPDIPRGLSFEKEGGPAGYQQAFLHARAHFITHDITGLPNPFTEAQRKTGMKLVAWTIRNAEQRHLATNCADVVIAEGQGIA